VLNFLAVAEARIRDPRAAVTMQRAMTETGGLPDPAVKALLSVFLADGLVELGSRASASKLLQSSLSALPLVNDAFDRTNLLTEAALVTFRLHSVPGSQ
jgi:hypothetical protein